MYGLQCLNWNLYFHFGIHKNTKGMVPHWCGNLFQKDQLFEQTWCIHWAHPLAMVFSLTIQDGSTPVPGYRSQKGFRNRQRAADSLQERSCHPAFLLMSCWPQFTCMASWWGHHYREQPCCRATGVCGRRGISAVAEQYLRLRLAGMKAQQPSFSQTVTPFFPSSSQCS